jgi:hypothetical protein
MFTMAMIVVMVIGEQKIRMKKLEINIEKNLTKKFNLNLLIFFNKNDETKKMAGKMNVVL